MKRDQMTKTLIKFMIASTTLCLTMEIIIPSNSRIKIMISRLLSKTEITTEISNEASIVILSEKKESSIDKLTLNFFL